MTAHTETIACASWAGRCPAVSVIVPTFNRRDMIARCMRALLRQTLPSVEVVVVDDGSKDGTHETLMQIVREDGRGAITVLRHLTTMGSSVSHNDGVAAANAPILAYLDDECIPDPDWARQLVRAFDDPSVWAATGLVIDAPPRNIFDLVFRGTRRVIEKRDVQRMVSGNFALRRTVFDHVDVNPDTGASITGSGNVAPDTRFSARAVEEGLCLNIRAAGGRVVSVPEAVVLHEHHDTFRSFSKQAFFGGRAAAGHVVHERLPHRLDVGLVLLGVATGIVCVPVGLFVHPLAFVFALLGFGPAALAIAFNEVARKGKSLAQLLVTAPVLVYYYTLRTWGYIIGLSFYSKMARLRRDPGHPVLNA